MNGLKGWETAFCRWLGLVVLLFWAVTQAAFAAPRTTAIEEAGSGQLLLLTDQPGRFRPAPVVSTDVGMAITAMVARVTVTQVFHNPGKEWIEGVYVFPLPEAAAVDHLTLRVGERLIEGVVREREAARRSYEQAKAEGRKASLVEQERPNIFTNSVANIGPGETVTVTIEYQQSLHLDQGRFRIRFPMVVGPRFVPGMPLATGQRLQPAAGTGWAFDTDQVPDASRITPPVLPPGRAPANPVRLEARLDAGFPLGGIESNYHAVTVTRGGEGRATVTLESLPADRDFELVWEPKAGRTPRAALFSQQGGGATYALLMLTPPSRASEQRLPRDVSFIIDTSGSMAGDSIAQARAALELAIARLAPGDRFNVIQFNSTTESLFSAQQPASERNKARARRYVGNLRATGGTVMAPALERALTGRRHPGRVHQVVFLTDGAVGNEEALFELIRRRLGDSRLFTVGIGSAPNSHFMTRAARFGRGTFTYIGRAGEVRSRMDGLFRKLETPVLTGIELHWPEGAEVEMYPARLPDLYAGEPLVVSARLPALAGEVELRGVQAGEGFRVALPLDTAREGDGVGVLWARRKIAELMDALHTGGAPEEVREKVVTVALEHHLVSRYTSLVAVDRTPTRPAGEGVDTRAVPANLPAGWEYDKVFGRLPQTATPAPAWLLAGAAALLLGGLGRRLNRGGRGRA